MAGENRLAAAAAATNNRIQLEAAETGNRIQLEAADVANRTQLERYNNVAGVVAYWDARAINRAARLAEEVGPRPTMEQLVRFAQQDLPKPLGPDQMDPVSGKLTWPSALQQAAFDAQRSAAGSAHGELVDLRQPRV